MPIINIQGMPRDPNNETNLVKCMEAVQKAVASVPELGLTSDQVTVFFQADLLNQGLGDEIIVEVQGLYKKDERTPEVLEALRNEIRDAVRKYADDHIPQCSLIEVRIGPMYAPEDISVWKK